MKSENFDIANKCSTICVCRILLQHFYIKIQKLNYNIDISNLSDLPFDVMFVSHKNDVYDTVPKESTIDMFLKTICENKWCKCFDIVIGSDGKRQGKKYRNISKCILN